MNFQGFDNYLRAHTRISKSEIYFLWNWKTSTLPFSGYNLCDNRWANLYVTAHERANSAWREYQCPVACAESSWTCTFEVKMGTAMKYWLLDQMEEWLHLTYMKDAFTHPSLMLSLILALKADYCRIFQDLKLTWLKGQLCYITTLLLNLVVQLSWKPCLPL